MLAFRGQIIQVRCDVTIKMCALDLLILRHQIWCEMRVKKANLLCITYKRK